MIEEAYAFEKIMKRKQDISLKKSETLVMLNLLLTDYHSGEKPKTTVIEDVKPESFEWVIKEAIRLIKEKENENGYQENRTGEVRRSVWQAKRKL